MEVLTSPATMRAWSRLRHRAGATVAFVPTMGALHDGHHELVRRAASEGEVVVSIFVNPLQFNRADDFDAYPRPIEDDLAGCRDLGVTAAYAPTAAAMYPPGFQTTVVPGALAEPLEGAGRPGHFAGVTTVVSKLFHAVDPDVAFSARRTSSNSPWCGAWSATSTWGSGSWGCRPCASPTAWPAPVGTCCSRRPTGSPLPASRRRSPPFVGPPKQASVRWRDWSTPRAPSSTPNPEPGWSTSTSSTPRS